MVSRNHPIHSLEANFETKIKLVRSNVQPWSELLVNMIKEESNEYW